MKSLRSFFFFFSFLVLVLLPFSLFLFREKEMGEGGLEGIVEFHVMYIDEAGLVTSLFYLS